MVWHGKKYFYIFEPTRLISGDIVIPIFFYKARNKLYAKCTLPEFILHHTSQKLQIFIPTNIRFESALMVVKTSQFSEMFSKIFMEDGMSLADFCQNTLYSEGFCLVS